MAESEMKYLKSLANQYPTIAKASTEIINLQAILNLPKGTEHFITDIHGEYDKYRRMLEKIRFSDDDIMYILGDVVDRGPEPAKILLDMMKRPNVVPLLGNHEAMAYPVLEKLAEKEFDFNKIDQDTMDAMREWIDEGGWTTIESFRKLPAETCRELLD